MTSNASNRVKPWSGPGAASARARPTDNTQNEEHGNKKELDFVSEAQRVALVTGATSGIGVEIARRLVADGMRVAISGRSAERGQKVAAELGEAVFFIQAELTAPGAPQRLIDEVVSRAGSWTCW